MDDVAFYDSQVQYQKRVGEIERERLRLEREMFSMMKSDKKLQNLKAARLKSYWQQVCEREKKARERNEQLLKDFESMEIELSALQTQTNKLRRMKAEYDEKVKQMYPKWRQEVEISRAKKQLQERGIRMSPRKENVNLSPVHGYPDPKVSSRGPALEGSPSPRKEDPGNMRQPKHRQESNLSSIDHSNRSNVSKAGSEQDEIRSHKPVLTSTPISVKSESQLASEASMQPPPESFADVTPQKVVFVNATSPIKSQMTESQSVVHTIPTAHSQGDDPSEVSEPSTFSEQQGVSEKMATSISKPGSTGHHVQPVASKPGTVAQTSGAKSQQNEVLSPTHSKHSQRSGLEVLTSAGQASRSRESIDSFSRGTPARSAGRFSPEDQHYARSPMSTLSSQGDQPRSPEPKVAKSASISSFSSDEISPRSSAPLRTNEAYQALLKQHSGHKPTSIDVPNVGEESDEDDLEDLLSPHGPSVDDRIQPPSRGDDSEGNSLNDDVGSPPVYIPTAMSTGSSVQARGPTKVTQSKPPKVPWDTDTEEEDSFEDTSFLATGGSSLRHGDKKPQTLDQDDFDFYD